MLPLFRCWFYLIFCIFMYGCSLMPNEIKNAERIMETNPDSALHILQHVRTDKLMLSSADRALYGLLLFQALDKNSQPLQPDSVINFSVNYYQNVNDKPRMAKSYFYKARVYKRAQRFDNATILYLKVLDLIQGKKDFVLLGEIYSDMGDICSFQLDYKESQKKYQKAKEYFIKANDMIDACYKLIDIGRMYRFLGNHNRARLCYKHALSQTPDSLLQGDAYQEIGINFYTAQQYDSAQYFLRKSLRFPYKGTNYAIRCSTLADLFFDIAQYDSAFHYASMMLRYPTTYFNQRDCYRILANTEYKHGDFKQMAFYMSKYQDCTDSIRKIEIQTKTTVLEDLHQTNGAFSKSRHFLILLGCTIPIILLLSLFIVYRLRKRSKGKEKQLEEVAVQLSEKQNLFIDNLIHQLQETRTSQAAAYKKATILQREQMDKELYNTCLHVNDWDAFKLLMNKTFNNIITILESNYSDLTRKDLTWCCLFLLDIPNQDIAIILDSQPASLYKLKSRLTQKMNLKSTKDLDLLLKEKSSGK
ncbi:MAG: tetratricopeptide repeat protein [Bacteroidota bacterium]|nr:tetratricopeptide repeat protein [Bacteroidota bacterium]